MTSAAPYIRLRKALVPPPVPVALPKGLILSQLDKAPTERIHKLLKVTFKDLTKPAQTWHQALVSDEEYAPELALVALTEHGEVAGYIQSWTTGFIKDLVVASDFRRQGLATALVLETFARFAARGLARVDLKVERKNKPAQKFYAGLGMFEVLD